MTSLFHPFSLCGVTLRNRIAVAPMSQYSAMDGFSNDWHLSHYAGLARGGAGLVVVEATAVSPEGRISPQCLGVWTDGHIGGLARIAAVIKAAGAVPGIQIAHAGRKGSANCPWEGDTHIPEGDPRGWRPLSPSAIAYGENLSKCPKEMTVEEIARVTGDFAAAARRVRDAGFEWLDLHFAHGYLAQSFFSVHANHRTDAYGGDYAGRGRFLRETLAAVRKVWPKTLPLSARFGVIEYDGRDEETLADSLRLLHDFKDGGLDLVNVSIGFSTPSARIPWGPGFLAPVAGRVRREVGLPVASAWSLDAPRTAERVIAEGQMDIVMIGRAMLANPHYPYGLARALGVERPARVLPVPYAHWLEKYQMPE